QLAGLQHIAAGREDRRARGRRVDTLEPRLVSGLRQVGPMRVNLAGQWNAVARQADGGLEQNLPGQAAEGAVGLVKAGEYARNDRRAIADLVDGALHFVALCVPVNLTDDVAGEHVGTRFRSGTAVIADGGRARTAGVVHEHASEAADAAVEW